MAKTGWGPWVPSCRGVGLDSLQMRWLETSTFLDGVSVSSQTICSAVGLTASVPRGVQSTGSPLLGSMRSGNTRFPLGLMLGTGSVCKAFWQLFASL